MSSAARPFVDRPFGELADATALATTCAMALDLPHPRVMRSGMNALFRAGDVVIRVGRPSAPAQLALELAAALRAIGLPVPRPASDEVWIAGEQAATCWELIDDLAVPVDWAAVGAAVRSVHALTASALPSEYPIPSPTGFPWWDFDHLMVELDEDLDPAARDGLQATIERHRQWTTIDPTTTVICHGDVHPGNVMMTDAGPLLLDWDLMCRAPAGWDHAMLVTYADRWGGAAGVYPEFARGYGDDLANDPTTRRFADLRNVAATLMRVRAGRSHPGAKAEAERRLEYWRGTPDPPAWVAQ